MRKIFLLTAIVLLVSLTTYTVLSHKSTTVENRGSLNISDPPNLISFVPAEQFSIKQGESHDSAFIITNNMEVGLSYHLEYDHPDFTLIPSTSFLAPGQSEDTSIIVSNSGSLGVQNLDAHLYADFDGGSAHLQTTLSVEVEEGG